MKKIIVFSVLLAVCAGFSSCRKKDPEPVKSRACDIITLKDGDRAWQVSGASITKGSNLSAVAPVVEISAATATANL